MVHTALLLLLLEAVHTDLVHHQPEAKHPDFSDLHKNAGRLPHLCAGQAEVTRTIRDFSV
jgi:hypothetical protein